MTTTLEKMARAIDAAELGYCMKLTRLVDGVSTYTLTIKGEHATEHADVDECYERIAEIKSRRRARAALEALLEPDEGVVDAGYRAMDSMDLSAPGADTVATAFVGMIKSILEEGR